MTAFVSPLLELHAILQDVAVTLSPLSESQQTYAGYLGNSLSTILGVRHCPVNKMTLCVTSDPELEKCVRMRVCTCFNFICNLNV